MAYTVQPGDSLWSIAQRELGDGSRWPEIQAANGLSGTNLQAGVTLNVPGGASEERTLGPDTRMSVADGPAEDFAPGGPSPEDGIGATDGLLQDPTYAAFLRGMGVQESQLESNLASLRSQVNRDITLAEGTYDEQRRQSEVGTNQAWENRGLFSSGSRLRNVQEGQTAIDQNQLAFQRSQTDRLAGAESDVAAQLAALRAQRAEQEIAARERLTIEEGQVAYQ